MVTSSAGASGTPLPQPRGPVSEHCVTVLVGPPRDGAPSLANLVRTTLDGTTGVLSDDDLQVTWYVLYELAYQGFAGVDDGWEWHADLLAARAAIDERVEAELRARVPVPATPEPTAEAVADALFALTGQDTGPGLSHYIARQADPAELGEILVHRSVFQLKEADPHTWAIPRLLGRPKAALVEIQSDEYGGGRPERMHAALFARTMRGLGLDDTYGRYVDAVPAVTLAWANVMSLFGLHRRWRGATVGHLTALEMTSSLANRRYSQGFRRHGHDAGTTEYFDEHVEADAVHEQIAGRDLAGALVEQDPGLADDVMFGAAVYLATDGWLADHVTTCWAQRRSSLREPVSVGEVPAGGATVGEVAAASA